MNLAIHTAIHHKHSIGKWLRSKACFSINQTGLGMSAALRYQEIAKDKILEIKQALGVTIECLEGSVWVTLDGSTRDVVLEAGQSFHVDRQQRTLIQALDTARVRLIHPPFSH